MDASSDLTAFIVLSEEPHVVQANFARTLNRGGEGGAGVGVKTFPLKLMLQSFGPFFSKKKFHPWLPQLLQSFGLKYTCVKRYALFPQFAHAASLMRLKKNC